MSLSKHRSHNYATVHIMQITEIGDFQAMTKLMCAMVQIPFFPTFFLLSVMLQKYYRIQVYKQIKATLWSAATAMNILSVHIMISAQLAINKISSQIDANNDSPEL